MRVRRVRRRAAGAPVTLRRMTIERVDVRESREAWILPVIVTLADEHGRVRRSYDQTQAGQARQELGWPLTACVGEVRLVHVGVTGHALRLSPLEAP